MVIALRYRNYRYYWVTALLASAGRWTETVIIGWVALQLTGSPFLVGLAVAFRWLGCGLSPIFGAIGDRYDRRKLLILGKGVSVLYSFTLAFLATTGLLQYWHVLIIGLIAGLTQAYEMPIRAAIIGDLVGEAELMNAVALNTVAIDITAMLGPALAGPLLNIIGVGGVSWMLMVIYFLTLGAFCMIRVSPWARANKGHSLFRDMAQGARYIIGHRPVLALLLIAVVFNLLTFSLRYTLVPVFASTILQVGAAGYGFLLAALGAGALGGAITVATLGNFRHKALLCILASVAGGVGWSSFSLSTGYHLSLGLMVLVGYMEAVGMTIMATLLMKLSPPEMRGRVMGVRSLAVLPVTLGSLMAGGMASKLGAPAAGAISASLEVALILAIALVVPSLRRVG